MGTSFSISKSAAEVNNISPVSTCLTSNFNSPDSEIEHYSNNGNHVLPSSQGIQKVTGHLNFYDKAIAGTIVVVFPGNFEQGDLFDNNYLHHNYPSHNFW